MFARKFKFGLLKTFVAAGVLLAAAGTALAQQQVCLRA